MENEIKLATEKANQTIKELLDRFDSLEKSLNGKKAVVTAELILTGVIK